MSFDPASVAKGLADRLADLGAARRRYESFAFTPGRDAPPPDDPEHDAAPAARDLVVRMLAALGDPVNDRLMGRLLDGDATLHELVDVAGLPPLAVWERVNDLVQVGLVRHAVDGDRAGLTGAGVAMAELVGDIAARAAEGWPR